MMANLREQVTYKQYDDPDLTWDTAGDRDSPYRQFIARHILPFIGDVKGQSVLDVGCGTGWLLHLLGERGASRLVGIEPSNYARLAARYYPEAEIIQSPIENYPTDETFDLVTLVMCTEVMDDLETALGKCARLIKKMGRVVLCKGNYDYFCADKYDYKLTREEYIPGHETVVKTERPNGYGTTVDIYRSTERVLSLAGAAGLASTGKIQPFTPDEAVIRAVPRYATLATQPMMELVELRLGSHS